MYKLELFEKELKATNKGKEILAFIYQHQEEVLNLINHNREVIVTWQRNKGPKFFSAFMASGFNKKKKINKHIEGVSLLSLIRRMAVVLQDYGSTTLRKSIDDYFLLIIGYAQSCNSLNQIFEKLRSYG